MYYNMYYIIYYIYIYFIYIYIYIYLYHLINGFSKNNIGRVHYSHVSNIHQVYISTSSKIKTKISIKENIIKYTTINPYYLLHF